MDHLIERINTTVAFLQGHGINKPETGIILGTGLGKLIDEIEVLKSIDYADIPDFPVSTVEFHKGKLIYGVLNGKRILALNGRFHFYEGYSMQEITFPVRVMKFLGIEQLIVSNAGGALNPDYNKGQLMLITDHINLLGGNPLMGPNLDELGPRFPDMSQPYTKVLNDKITSIALKNGFDLKHGIYVAVAGPNLETRAEYRYLRFIGADVVGMSTIPEVLVANHMGLPVCAISVITDECDPDNLQVVDIKDILAIAAEAEKDLIVIVKELMKEI